MGCRSAAPSRAALRLTRPPLQTVSVSPTEMLLARRALRPAPDCPWPLLCCSVFSPLFVCCRCCASESPGRPTAGAHPFNGVWRLLVQRPQGAQRVRTLFWAELACSVRCTCVRLQDSAFQTACIEAAALPAAQHGGGRVAPQRFRRGRQLQLSLLMRVCLCPCVASCHAVSWASAVSAPSPPTCQKGRPSRQTPAA